MILTINNENYRVEYGYNCFCDTDLMDRVQTIATIIHGAETDADVNGLGKIKELFCVVRELLFVGFEKYNPVESVQVVGNLLDDYKKEATEDDDHGLLSLFTKLSEELMNEGFLSDLLKETQKKATIKKVPTDHKKAQK